MRLKRITQYASPKPVIRRIRERWRGASMGSSSSSASGHCGRGAGWMAAGGIRVVSGFFEGCVRPAH